MKQLNFLQKLTPIGVATLGAIAVTGFTTSAAQAFITNSTLGWGNGTSDFYDSAKGVLDSDAGSFSVDYCLVADCESAISIASGSFVPYFDPLEIVPLDSIPTATWAYASDLPEPAGFVTYADFTLNSDLEFEFVSQQPGFVGDIVTAVLPAGSLIEGGEKTDGALEFELESGEWVMSIPGMTAPAFSSVFQFGQVSPSAPGGVYDAEAIVPEPLTILGTTMALGFGTLFKKRRSNAS